MYVRGVLEPFFIRKEGKKWRGPEDLQRVKSFIFLGNLSIKTCKNSRINKQTLRCISPYITIFLTFIIHACKRRLNRRNYRFMPSILYVVIYVFLLETAPSIPT